MVSTNCNEHTVSSVYIYTRAFLPKENGVEVMLSTKTRVILSNLLHLNPSAKAEIGELESKAKLADAFVWVLEHQPELIGLLYTYRGSYNLSRVPQSLIEAYEKGKVAIETMEEENV